MQRNVCNDDVHLEDCNCAGMAGKKVDELIELQREFLKIKRQACQDQEELIRLRAAAINSRQPESASESTLSNELATAFKNFAATLESAVTSRQMRFEDVEKSLKTFNGSGCMNIEAWIKHFSEQADSFKLTDFQRFAYAKRLMRDTAKLFIDHESKATAWAELQKELTNEFGKKVNSAIIHRKLREKRKKKEETNTQYLYDMVALAAQANIEAAALVSYIVDGLPGTLELKIFMYEATSISELKLKLINYEMLLSKQQQNSVRGKYGDFKQKPKNEESQKGCYKCGDLNHKKYQCAKKNSGPKCYKCGEFGHVIRCCPTNESRETKKNNCIKKSDLNTRKWVKVNGHNYYALIDTGSDYTVIRDDKASKLNCEMTKSLHENKVKGVGGYANLMGKFPAEI